MIVGLLLLFALPLSAQQAVGSPSPFQLAKARALLQTQLPCLGCHELDGDGGRAAPSLTTVAQRRGAEYIRAIIEDPQRVLPGAAMPKTEMPVTMRETIVRYLARDARPEPPQPPPAAAGTAQPADARTLYAKWCASCHGNRGDGDGFNARYLPIKPAIHADAAAMSARSDDALFDVIAAGGSAAGKSPRMPAFGATLSPGEMRALVAHIRELCRCEGPAWSRDGSNR
jgi:mono/diheme cytochrome c family protein